jgi:hypothetical protein
VSNKHRNKDRDRSQRQHGSEHQNPSTRQVQGETSMVYAVRVHPHPDDENRYAEEQKYKRQQLASATKLNVISATGAVIAFFALVALVWYACITRGQLSEMQTQRRLSVRPFVGLDEGSEAIKTTTLHIDETGAANLTYIIRAKNYSNSPATNVWADANLVVADDLYTVYEQQGYACGDAVIGKPDVGLVLFQGRDRVFTSYPAIATINVKHQGSRLQAFLAGCIGYRDQFGYLYRTKFIYMLYDDAGNVVVFDRPTQSIDIGGHFAPAAGSIDAGQTPKYK